MPTTARRADRERGAVGVLMLAVVVIGLVVALGALRLGAAAIGRARAETAADATALAAADSLALGDGPGAARAAAERAAAANDGRLLACECDGAVATVLVEVDVPGLDVLGGVARARARAEVRPECAVDLPDCE
ncbi:MAG: Rv3654c family TadE-like protein [Acidimicrobiia bacterium]